MTSTLKESITFHLLYLISHNIVASNLGPHLIPKASGSGPPQAHALVMGEYDGGCEGKDGN